MFWAGILNQQPNPIGRRRTLPRALSFTPTNGELFVEDLSSNGTWLNGERLPSRQAVQAQHGDLIEILGYSIQIGLPELQPAPAESSLATATEAIESPKPAWKAVVDTAVHFFSPSRLC